MQLIGLLRCCATAFMVSGMAVSSCTAFAGSIKITSPVESSSSSGPVAIAATAQESQPFHLEIWDNGNKLGNIHAGFVNTTANLSSGSHTTTVLAVSNRGVVLDKSNVSYTVAKRMRRVQ